MIVATLWSPATNAGVLVQVVLTLVVVIIAIVLVRSERSLVLLVVGVAMVLLGWYGIRGLH